MPISSLQQQFQVSSSCAVHFTGGLLGWLSTTELARIIEVIRTLDLALYVPELALHLPNAAHPDGLPHSLQEFREHLGGRLTRMPLTQIGRGVEVAEINDQLVVAAVQQLQQYEAPLPPSVARLKSTLSRLRAYCQPPYA